MAFTYSSSLASAVDRVRFACGDNVDRDHILEDAEITYLLTANGNDELQAAIDSLERMIAHVWREIDRSGVGVNNTRSQKITHLETTLKLLQARAERSCGLVSGDWADGDVTFTGQDTDD